MTPPRDRSAAGWTLIELIAVFAISAILAAIAIPTFLGSRNYSADSAAEAKLDAVAGVLQEVWAQYGTDVQGQGAGFTSAELPSEVHGLDSDLNIAVAGTTTGVTPPANPVADVLSSSEVELAALSDSGKCLYLDFVESPSTITFLNGGTWYGSGPALAPALPGQSQMQCYVAQSPLSGWAQSWADVN